MILLAQGNWAGLGSVPVFPPPTQLLSQLYKNLGLAQAVSKRWLLVEFSAAHEVNGGGHQVALRPLNVLVPYTHSCWPRTAAVTNQVVAFPRNNFVYHIVFICSL